MKSKEAMFGVSHLELKSRRRAYGPVLRFAVTVAVTLEDDRILAFSVPGFLAMKRRDGSYAVKPPVRNSNTTSTYYSAMISPDLLDMVTAHLHASGWMAKVGTNYKLNTLADLPVDLSSDLPANAVHLE